MSAAGDDSLLLDALLERLGRTESQSLLARLDRWLADDEPDGEADPESTSLDRNQFAAIAPAYDRRKRTKSGTPTPNLRKAS